jgi:hypothetical protein
MSIGRMLCSCAVGQKESDKTVFVVEETGIRQVRLPYDTQYRKVNADTSYFVLLTTTPVPLNTGSTSTMF